MLFNCGHKVCRKCLHSYILDKFNNLDPDYFYRENTPFLTCPTNGCELLLNSWEVFDVMLESRTGEILKERIKYAVGKGKFDGKYECPNESCHEFVSRGDYLSTEDEQFVKVNCKICNEDYLVCGTKGCNNLVHTDSNQTKCGYCGSGTEFI